jgi:hypothetical protein
MTIITPVTPTTPIVPTFVERRTYDLRLISERGGQNFIVAQREEYDLDAGKNPIGEPRKNWQVRKDLSEQFLTDNPDVATLIQTILDKVDAWEAAQVGPQTEVVLTVEQRIAVLVAAVQKKMDETAKTRNYDGILSLCSYASSTNTKFATEALAGMSWRDACWDYCYTLLASVQAGTAQEPSVQELLAGLPTISW